MSAHIALLGDSIFDNKAYTSGSPDVVAHLNDLLPPGWRASLGAPRPDPHLRTHRVDGATTDDIPAQLQQVPQDASRLVISIGGNDVLHNYDLLDTLVGSTAETLALFGERLSSLETAYRSRAFRGAATNPRGAEADLDEAEEDKKAAKTSGEAGARERFKRFEERERCRKARKPFIDRLIEELFK